MFEKDRSYPSAYISDRADDARRIAVRWVLEQSQLSGGQPLLYAPGKQNVQHDPLLSQFGSRYALMTWRTRYGTTWSGGPVLAAWPDAKHLGEAADMPKVTALCVLAWLDKDVLGWAAAHGAANLDPTASAAALPLIDPVVREGLRDLGLSVNHSNALAGVHDKADGVAFFRALVDARLPIDPEALYAHALADGWPASGAQRLKEMATKVAAGKRLQGWNDGRWRADVVDHWRRQAGAAADGEA
jgi:hypothetical protein